MEDLSATELVEAWFNGNHAWVFDKLKENPPHYTALVTLVIFRDYGGLEANQFVNLMTDYILKDYI